MAQTVEEIAELLEVMKAEITRSNDGFNKILTSINNKLDVISNDTEADDLIKVYLADIKTTISERHSVILDEFEKNEALIKEFQNSHSDLVKTSDIREMFDIFSNNMQNVGQELNTQREILGQFDEKFTNFSEDKADKNEILKSISGVKKRLDSYGKDLSLNISEIKEKFEQTQLKLDEILSATSDAVKEVSLLNDTKASDKVIEDLSDKIQTVKEDLVTSASINAGNLSSQIDNLAQTVETVKSDISAQIKSNDKTNLKNLNNIVSLLQETLTASNSEEDTGLTEKLVALRDMIQDFDTSNSSKLCQLKDSIDSFTQKVNEIAETSDAKIENSLIEISDLKSEIDQISQDFTSWNLNQEAKDSKLVGMISSELNEIGTTISSLQETISAGVHKELTDVSDLIEKQINDLTGFLQQLEDEMKGEKSDFNTEEAFKDFKDKINAVKQEINLANTDIIDTLNSRAEAIMFELSPLKATLDGFFDLHGKIDEKFEESLSLQEALIKKTAEDIKNEISAKLAESYEELSKNSDESFGADLKETLTEKITSSTEDIKNMLSVALNNDDVTWAIDEMKSDISDKVTKLLDEHSDIQKVVVHSEEISEQTSKISELLDILNQKVDILAMSDDSYIQDEINEIKELIYSQRNIIENSDGFAKSGEVESRLQELIDKIENTSHSELGDVRESIITAILNVFEQISFIEESEDIKDFVEEKTDEINYNLNEVKKQLNQITNADGYSYTLQDVESDIAKLRLALNEFSSSASREDIADISDDIHKIVTSVEDLQNSLTQEQISGLKADFEKLSEDILSISSRTNKLILTSDESYNALSNGLNDFSSLIYKLEERINYLDNKEISERIEEKLDNVACTVTESANSDKVMRQALMYMGEWIDTASENLESLCEQSDSVEDIRDMIEQLQKKMPEQTELLNAIADRFDEQQERIDRVELTLEKVLNAIDNIDDTKLIKKVDKIDKQLAKLSQNIEKLAAYVDE